MKPRFSICIPVWEQGGFGLKYLGELIDSIKKQTFENYEIVVSDHSKDDMIRNYLMGLVGVPVVYVKYQENYGNGVANLNNALKQADGEIIKVIFQDDLMYSKDCLKILNYTFTDEVEWVVTGCNHTNDGVNFERPMAPSWNDQLLYGVNSISSPSVLSFRNKDIELFDEELVMLMDVEYYYRLYKRFGLPKFLNDVLVTNRCHKNQISSKYTGDMGVEVSHVKNKYNL